MARPRRWVYSDLINGVGIVKLSSWKYFTDYIYQEMLDYTPYIWRGQRCDDWGLETTLDRLLNKAKVARTKRIIFQSNHLLKFKYASRGRRGSNPIRDLDENDWWALGQHSGLATPLLDWTISPFVAAFFAFMHVGDKQTSHRSVFALHRPSIESSVNKIIRAKEKENRDALKAHESGKAKIGNILHLHLLREPVKPEVEFVRPMSDENLRLVNQSGLFTRTPPGEDIENWIIRNHKHIDSNGYILMKILIPNKDRDMCLRMLNRMNINHLTLFPDLYGASNFCNTFAEIKNY